MSKVLLPQRPPAPPRRAAKRRRRPRYHSALDVVLVAAVAYGLVAGVTYLRDRDPSPRLAAPATTAAATVASTIAPTTVPTPVTTVAPTTAPAPATTAAAPVIAPGARLRTPTPEQPLAIWVGGDSLAEGLGSSVARLATQTGAEQATVDGRISSGLTRPDYIDWPAELASVMTAQAPEVMVMMVGANDPQPITGAGGTYPFGTAEWEAEYRTRVHQVMATVAATRPLVWVGLPVMGRELLEPKLSFINRIYQEEAAAVPGVVFVDARGLFSPDGGYHQYLTAPDGTTQLVRADDGIHLTVAGNDRLAAAVLEAVAALSRPT
jgi:hypothetical protein